MSLTVNLNHIAIRGSSFCGSTVLSYVLGCLNGCENIGESHWITSWRGLGCLRCGDSCCVISPDLKKLLSMPDARHYEVIRKAHKAKYLISSDKDPEILERFDPMGDRAELVLFKHPGENFISHLKVTGESASDCYKIYLNDWLRIYSHVYENPPLFVKYLIFNDFLNNKDGVVQEIVRSFGISDCLLMCEVKDWWKYPHHTVGGNFNPFDDFNSSRREIKSCNSFSSDSLPSIVLDSKEYLNSVNLFEKMMKSQDRIITSENIYKYWD